MTKNLTTVVMISGGLMACGQVGPAGAPGATGPQGMEGTPGIDGKPCYEAPIASNGILGDPAEYGGVMLTCSNGSAFIANGRAGAPGTVIKAVQFCPGVAPSYPSSFPEYGVCLDNVLYGVYSSNGGFLAALPPGTYSSDGINASCTFRIGPNCTVN